MADIREKSNNIYKLDDRYYVKKISNCSCIRKEDDRYLLTCRIKGRGEKDYYVDDDPEYIRRDSKRLWLSDEARVQIKEAVDNFKERAEELQGDSSIKIVIKPCNTVICLRKRNETEYDFLLEIKNPHNISGCSNLLLLLESSDVGSMIKELSFHIPGDDKTVDLIRHSTPETISENPIYQSAVKTDDPYMQRLIKLYYHIADEDDCRWLSDNVMGMEILPSLSEEYNKGYYISADEIDRNMIIKSGYTILHKPYFAMAGHTHSAWTLNPHTKFGTDAAPVKEEKITFEEYLKLFGRCS